MRQWYVTHRKCAAVLLLGLLFIAPTCLAAVKQHPLVIWLASTQQCNSCGIFAQASERRGYDQGVQYPSTSQQHLTTENSHQHIPVIQVNKHTLQPDVIRQLGDNNPQDNPNWEIELLVLVMQGETVLSYGNIADSVDLNQATFAQSVMSPGPEASADDPATHYGRSFAEYFIQHWNLEFFVNKALNQSQPVAAPMLDPGQGPAISLASPTVAVWGSAAVPYRNSLFISQRIKDIQQQLSNWSPKQQVVLFGHGPDSQARDTSYIEQGKIKFKRADVIAQLDAGKQGLGQLFSALATSNVEKTLLIQVGHAAPYGAPVWGHLAPLTADELKNTVARTASELVMVSGACHGGIFAEVGACGFFAAHPQTVASGCQKSAEAVLNSDDYLHHFFRPLSDISLADSDADGHLQLHEAHWFAAARMEPQNVPYTTLDARVDEYFNAHPTQLADSISLSEFKSLSATANPAERTAVEYMTAGLSDDATVILVGHIQKSQAAVKRLAAMTEMSSQQRLQYLQLPHPLALSVLARRWLYRSLVTAADPAQACQTQPLTNFF